MSLGLSFVLIACTACFVFANDSKKTADTQADVTKITILGSDQMQFNLK